MKNICFGLLYLLLAIGSSGVRAQGIERVNAPFVDRSGASPSSAVVGGGEPALPLAPATGTSRRPKAATAGVMAPLPDVWVLKAGQPIHAQLAKWAATAGWEFTWKVDKGYIPPADARFAGSFDTALEEVVKALFAEGVPVHLRVWEGNRVAEVVRSTPQ